MRERERRNGERGGGGPARQGTSEIGPARRTRYDKMDMVWGNGQAGEQGVGDRLQAQPWTDDKANFLLQHS